MEQESKELKIAVLIDADNVSQKYIKFILDEIASHGTPTYKRIYGDWTKPQLGQWKDVLLEHSITPIQQYGYTSGKNSTDSALIIDAMDILYSNNVDGFCIVSSDSDFTRLAARLRESGMYVVGMGEKKTPRPFVVACEKFKYLEALSSVPVVQPVQSEKAAQPTPQNGKAIPTTKPGMQAPAQAKPTIESNDDDRQELIASLRSIVTELSDDDGWAFLGEVGNLLNKRHPEFDTRNYGFAKLTPLVASLKVFEIISRRTSNPHISHKFIKNK